MKKILLVTRPICPPWDEGSKNFAYYLARNIQDFEFGVLTKGIIPNLPENIQQKAIYTSNEFSFIQKIRLIKNLRKIKNDFDILHYVFTPTKQNSSLIKKFVHPGKKAEIKTIQTVATLREDLYSDQDLKELLFGDMIITYSDYTANKILALGFDNVKRVYPGIDLEEYHKKEKNTELMKKYNFSEKDFVINFTGEYTRLGAMDNVINSFIEISKTIPNAKLSLAVRIKNSADANKKKQVIEKLKENNLLEKVAFHDDKNYLMADIYNLCDISIFPVQDMKGKFDVPLAVIEAMACEKSVIISDLEILQEFAKDDNSIKIEKGNLPALVKEIINLHEFPEERERIGKEARKYVEENFDIKKVARIYQNIYEALYRIEIDNKKNIMDLKINKEMKTEKMKVPAFFSTTQNLRNEIFEQIEEVAKNEKIYEKVAVLSDAHLKNNVLSPEGTIVASEGFILPQMLDTALNCGMRVIKTDLHDQELTPEKIEKLFLNLQKEIPTKKYISEAVPYYLAKRVLLQGSSALEKYYDFRIKNEIGNTYSNGNFFNNPLLKSFKVILEEDIFNIIPEIFVKLSRYRYGILGATDSHSITLSRVESIVDQGVADMLMDIKKGQYILTMHTGSGIIGRYISYLYSPQKPRWIHKIPVMIGKYLFSKEAKRNYQKVERALDEFNGDPDKFGFDENSEEGKMCLQAYLMAGNIGFANRAMLSHKVDLILEKFLNRVVDLNLLYDTPHVFIDKEKQGETELFIHRNGAVRAQKYETVYVAPFMQTFGYIGVGTNENQETFFSANHEIGKIEDTDQEFLQKLSPEKKTGNEVLIFSKDGMKKVLPEIQHELYAEAIAKEMEDNKIFKIVAKFKPIAILTY